MSDAKEDPDAEILNELIFEEGDKACAYPDSLGYLTVAIGRCVDPRIPGAGLSPPERRYLARNDIWRVRGSILVELPWAQTLTPPRFNVLIQMAFQDGVSGLLKFNKFLGLVKGGFYIDAAADLLTTLAAKQAPARYKRLADQMRTGESQYPRGQNA